eukprot:3911495-Rhodomonas_salina.1
MTVCSSDSISTDTPVLLLRNSGSARASDSARSSTLLVEVLVVVVLAADGTKLLPANHVTGSPYCAYKDRDVCSAFVVSNFRCTLVNFRCTLLDFRCTLLTFAVSLGAQARGSKRVSVCTAAESNPITDFPVQLRLSLCRIVFNLAHHALLYTRLHQ